DLILLIYPRLNESIKRQDGFLTERTILSARNDDVSSINNEALHMFPGESITFVATDKIQENEAADNTYDNRYLKLKVGCPIMLLRKLAPKDGFCNGTRLIVVRCGTRIIEAKILTGAHSGKLVFIPRISLTPSTTEMPFQMTRR
ncbi:hypothetical protein GIB67_020410, partial [Kingdonia uniflora]